MIKTDEWAFVHIPKTSGKNFIKNLEKNPEVENCFMPFGVSLACHQPLWWWEKNGYVNDSLTIFTFVRNPYQRMASFYNHLINDFTIINNDRRCLRKGYNISFKEFLLSDFCKIREDNMPYPCIWKILWPQTEYVKSVQNRKVLSFKMESDLLQVENLVKHKFTHTRINTGKSYNWRSYYCQQTIDFINRYHESDFEKFDYNIINSVENL
jgi:hypothetical protein